MKLDWVTLGLDPVAVGADATRAEQRGYAGWFTGETASDALTACALAANATETIEVGTAIAVAFARNPMITAATAHDLQRLSRGRFVLGLGTQIKPHIERRFSMPWSRPAARMREFVLALRAIWAAWNDGEPLRFEGEFYRHTLMTPFFAPPPAPGGAPQILISAVGPRLTEVAGEVCDGVMLHAFTTERYVRDVSLPALRRGRQRAGAHEPDRVVVGSVFVITGNTDTEIETSRALVTSQIGFYGSTPAYRPVLELHGWGELGDELNRLTKEGRWGELPGLIDDEVVEAFAVRGEPEQIGTMIRDRYGDVMDRVGLYTTYAYDDDDERAALIEGLAS